MIDERPRIVSIVAGYGEVAAVPLLIRRIASEVDPTVAIDCPRPIRTRQHGFTAVASGERERSLADARAAAGPRGAILILVDGEGAPPCQRGPSLLQQVHLLALGRPLGLVFAHQEYEAWFLAAASSLSDAGLLLPSIPDHPNPEGIRDAKGWLADHMPSKKYAPTTHQARFTARFDLQAARRAGWFDKCYREIERLVRAVSAPA